MLSKERIRGIRQRRSNAPMMRAYIPEWYMADMPTLFYHIDDQQALIDRLVGMLEAVLDINTPAAAGISHHVIKTVDGTASVTYKCVPPGCRVCEIDRQARALLEEVDRG